MRLSTVIILTNHKPTSSQVHFLRFLIKKAAWESMWSQKQIVFYSTRAVIRIRVDSFVFWFRTNTIGIHKIISSKIYESVIFWLFKTRCLSLKWVGVISTMSGDTAKNNRNIRCTLNFPSKAWTLEGTKDKSLIKFDTNFLEVFLKNIMTTIGCLISWNVTSQLKTIDFG